MENAIERPTINFTGTLTDENAIELIDRIRVLRDQFYFDEVQLRIASPGGQLTALKYVAECVQELQGDGLKIATHAITTVASAAAVMLSLGDVRTAHRKSLLRFHTGRLPGVHGAITAKGAESIATALNSADDEIVSLLVDRAARAPAPEADTPVELFAIGDWTVIDRLSPRNARKPKTMLRMFRKRVADAYKDPSTRLRKLYSDFCALDSAVSPYLALELGLIDAVGDCDPRERSAVADDGGGLMVPEWESLYAGGRVPRAALTRHTLILGETGSGKTASGILPVLSAITGEASPVSCALVIDPKSEIYPLLRRYAGPDCTVRLLRAGVDSINVMGKSTTVAEDVSEGKWIAAAQTILACAASISDSPARVFAGRSASSAVNSFWEAEGSRLARCVLAFTLLITKKDGRLEELVSNDLHLLESKRRHLTEFAEFAGLLGDGKQERPPNVLAIAHRALHDFFVESTVSSMSAAEVIDALRKADMADGDHDAVDQDANYWERISSAANQYAGVLGEARVCFAGFADPAASKSLFFGLERKEATVDFAPDVEVDNASKGRVIYVYQPALGHNEDALIAKALKRSFFQTVLSSPARRERGGKMPLCLYVADEFHRFITSDTLHGEQSFLDSCRSFGTACVLATQSEASIRHALALAREPSPDTAIKILLTNTATKLVFRSTEESVRKLVDGLSPGDGPHRLTAIRPPTTLSPGECYASLPDGRFERRQLKQYKSPKKVIDRTATCR